MNRADLLAAIKELDPVKSSQIDHRSDQELLHEIDQRALKASGRWSLPARMRSGRALAIACFVLVLALMVPLYFMRSHIVTPATSPNYLPSGVITFVPIGSGAGVRAFAIAPDGNFWVMSANERVLYEVDPVRGEVIGTHPIDAYAEGVTIGGGSIWLMAYDPPAILRFDPNAGLFNRGGVVDQIDLSEPAGGPWAFDSLWASNDNGHLLRFDQNGIQIGDFPVDAAGSGARFKVAFDGSLWMTSPNGLVYRIDPVTGSVLARIEVEGETWALTGGSGFLWVSVPSRDVVVKIDPATNQVVTETNVGRFPHSLAVVGSSVWVSNFDDYTISEIDVNTAEVVRTVALPGRPGSLEAVGGSLWVTLYRGAALVEIDPKAAMLEMPDAGRLDQVVTIEDRAIRILCTGTGSPTIVLEADAGEGAGSWSVVQALLSPNHRVCSSDRSGSFAVSDASSSGSKMPDDLYQALLEAGEPGPYLLVGHFQGGFVVRAFADHHPDEVVGMVLVDPQPDHLLEQVAAILPEGMLRQFAQGLARDDFREVRSEVSGKSLGSLPLIVIGADVSRYFAPNDELGSAAADQLREAYRSGQEELATLSSNGRLLIAEGSDSGIPWWSPELVVDAIGDLVG